MYFGTAELDAMCEDPVLVEEPEPYVQKLIVHWAGKFWRVTRSYLILTGKWNYHSEQPVEVKPVQITSVVWKETTDA